MTLQELIDDIVSRWDFNHGAYPDIQDLTGDAKLVFAIRHLFLHQGKANGLLAEALEVCEHKGAGQLDKEKVKQSLCNSLTLALRLAHLMGMSASDLVEACKTKSLLHDPTYG